MLHEVYIQQELHTLRSRRAAPAVPAHMLADILRSRSLLRRSARLLGIWCMRLGARLHRYGVGTASQRLSSPIPPIVEFRVVK